MFSSLPEKFFVNTCQVPKQIGPHLNLSRDRLFSTEAIVFVFHKTECIVKPIAVRINNKVHKKVNKSNDFTINFLELPSLFYYSM